MNKQKQYDDKNGRRRRRRMKKFSMAEISGVTRPAQGPALTTIMKSDDLAKISFDDALRAQQMSREIMEALDGMWELNSALRNSIESILENPEDYPNPQESIRESIAAFGDAVEEMTSNVTVVTKQSNTDGGSFTAADYAYVPDPESPEMWKLRLTIEPGGAPDPRLVEAVTLALGPDPVVKGVTIPEKDLPAVLKRVADAWLESIPNATRENLPEVLKTEESYTMTEQEIKELQKSNEDMQARLAKAEKVSELTDAQKAHYAKLDDAGKDAFLAKSADERQTEIDDLAKGDPVVYTDGLGQDYRKSDDPRMVNMAKQADKDREAVQKANDRADAAEYAKRAGELSNLPGTEEVKITMLKAIDGIEDKDAREEALKALKSKNAAASSAFDTHGTVAKSEVQVSAEEELNKLAEAYAKDNDVEFAEAYTKVLETEKGQELYEQSAGE